MEAVRLIMVVLGDLEEVPALNALNPDIVVVCEEVEESSYDTSLSFYRGFRQSVKGVRADLLLKERPSRPSKVFGTFPLDDLMLLMIHLIVTFVMSDSDLDV